jgi:hypothetical protein
MLGASVISACKSKQSFVSVGQGKDHSVSTSTPNASVDGGLGKRTDGGRGATRLKDGGTLGTTGRKRDGGPNIDTSGATMDAAALKLDASLALPDGSLILKDGAILLPDGDVIDVDAAVKRYTPEINVATCGISASDTWSTTVEIGDEGGYALVPGQTGFGLAYRALGNMNCAREIDVAHVPASSGFPEPHSVLPDCNAIRDVTLLGLQDGWRVAWIDNFSGTAELHTLMLDLDMNVADGESRMQLTRNDLFERRPVLAQVEGQTLLAWVGEDPSSGKARITTQQLQSGQRTDVVKEEDGHKPQALALAQMGMKAAAIGWVGPEENPGVWLLKLDANGAAVDAPIQLTDKVAVSSSIDLANRFNGGAAIYSIELDGLPQVRFRRLDENGQPLADERTIVGPPLRAQSASIDTLGGGYAVAYRALPGGPVTDPEVRLTFVTKEGNVIRDPGGQLVSFPIGAATTAEGRTYVAVSVEGEIMVGWIDADPTSGKNLLKLVRRRLDCH